MNVGYQFSKTHKRDNDNNSNKNSNSNRVKKKPISHFAICNFYLFYFIFSLRLFDIKSQRFRLSACRSLVPIKYILFFSFFCSTKFSLLFLLLSLAFHVSTCEFNHSLMSSVVVESIHLFPAHMDINVQTYVVLSFYGVDAKTSIQFILVD